MSEEEINSFDELNIDLKDIDELALGLEVCSKKSNMLIQDLVKDFFKYKQALVDIKELVNLPIVYETNKFEDLAKANTTRVNNILDIINKALEVEDE